MKYVYDMNALRVYSRTQQINLKEMAEMIGMSYNSISRYASGARLPDLNVLLLICNRLRISVSNFIHHPDVEPTSIQVFLEEEFVPIKYKCNSIENFRISKEMDRIELLRKIKRVSDVSVTICTYNRLKNGESVGVELPLGFLNTFCLDLNFFFDDEQLKYSTDNETESVPIQPSEEITIPRETLIDLKKKMKAMEEENRRLTTEVRRLKTREHAHYMGVSPGVQADREIRNFIRRAERALTDLKNYLPNDQSTNE